MNKNKKRRKTVQTKPIKLPIYLLLCDYMVHPSQTSKHPLSFLISLHVLSWNNAAAAATTKGKIRQKAVCTLFAHTRPPLPPPLLRFFLALAQPEKNNKSSGKAERERESTVHYYYTRFSGILSSYYRNNLVNTSLISPLPFPHCLTVQIKSKEERHQRSRHTKTSFHSFHSFHSAHNSTSAFQPNAFNHPTPFPLIFHY